MDKGWDVMEEGKVWVEHPLIRPKSIERREYQISIAETAKKSNTLVVLPTGLGKTTIALLLIADILNQGKRALFLAPTRVLVHQHYNFLKEHLISGDVSVLTGEVQKYERIDIWKNADVVCSTPQIALNDIERGFISAGDFALLVFDEAHRAVGDYSYARIASLLITSTNNAITARVVGFTATLPDDRERVLEIVRNLMIERIEVRDESSVDVRPYIKDTRVEFVTVYLTPVMRMIRAHVEKALQKRLEELKSLGIINSTRVNLSHLINAREIIAGKGSARALYSAIRLSHALKVLDTQGIRAFTRFYERLREKSGVGVRDLLEDGELRHAFELARGAEVSGLEHPKLSMLVEVLRKEGFSKEYDYSSSVSNDKRGKAIVFTTYRDSVEVITSRLRDSGFRVGYLIGKAGMYGLRQEEQIDAVSRFKAGEYDILVATSVGEEGLDIAECNLVIFYDNVPSAIRFVQRKGRTGRRMPGKVIVLVARDTIDEAYHWISRRKVRQVRSIADTVNRMIANGKGSGSNSANRSNKFYNSSANLTNLDDFIR